MTRALILSLLAIFAWSGPALAHPAWGIGVDRQGQVYFSDLKTVWKIDTQGKLSVVRPADDRHTHDLNVDADGTIYGADNSYDAATQRYPCAIWKITPSGVFSYLVPPTTNPPEGISIWRDAAGNTYHVGNYPGHALLVLRRSPNGEVKVLAGDNRGAASYRQESPYSAGGVAVMPDGTLYFTHSSSVGKLTPDGTLTYLVRDLRVEGASKENPESHSPLFGVAVDDQLNVFVADYGNRRVIKIAPDLRVVSVATSEGIWFPTGVAIHNGELYTLEEGHTPDYKPLGARVRKVSSDGNVRTLATVGADGATSRQAESQVAGDVLSRRQVLVYVMFGLIGLVYASLFVWVVWNFRRPRVRM